MAGSSSSFDIGSSLTGVIWAWIGVIRVTAPTYTVLIASLLLCLLFLDLRYDFYIDMLIVTITHEHH